MKSIRSPFIIVPIATFCATTVVGSGCTHQPPSEGRPATPAPAKAASPTGTFEGYVEATPEAPVPLTLIISSIEKDGSIVGTMLLGDESFVTQQSQEQFANLFKGYRFQLLGSSLVGNRARFGVAVLAPYESWCEKQKSYGSRCAPSRMRREGDTCYGSNGGDDKEEVVDCQLFEMCGIASPCECDEAGCRADLKMRISFDMVFDGNGWTGSVLGFGDGPRTVRFRRVSKD